MSTPIIVLDYATQISINPSFDSTSADTISNLTPSTASAHGRSFKVYCRLQLVDKEGKELKLMDEDTESRLADTLACVRGMLLGVGTAFLQSTDAVCLTAGSTLESFLIEGCRGRGVSLFQDARELGRSDPHYPQSWASIEPWQMTGTLGEICISEDMLMAISATQPRSVAVFTTELKKMTVEQHQKSQARKRPAPYT